MTGIVALVDYGAGNLHSVYNALKKAGAAHVEVTSDPALVRGASRVVLPGVGAFAACRDALRAVSGMVEAMEEAVLERGVPFLGICVGMQLLAERGEEHGSHEGLGWVAGTVRLIERADPAIKIPHMGWNDVTLVREHPLLHSGEAYFLHSYHFDAASEANVMARTDHGGPLVAAVGRDNIMGVQFHPEKSQSYGIQFLRRFLEWHP